MNKEKATILIIDDSESFLGDMNLLLKNEYRILTAENGRMGLEYIKNENIDLVLLDLFFKKSSDGLSILKEIKKINATLPVIMITDYSSVETAVKAMHLGALDYISKTPEINRLRLLIQKVMEEQILLLQKESLQEEAGSKYRFMVGASDSIQKIREQIDLYADINSPVLITGETGTGKELVARQLHLRSNRQKSPFIPINCAAIPENLIESELFGHEKGAFTGANKRKLGKFEIAGNGTLFLDEVSRLSSSAQLKLLRILQENEFQRVGGNDTIICKARIVAASNESLEKMVARETFREDLFYRLNVLTIYLPPLRERPDDLDELIPFLTNQICDELKFSRCRFSPEAVNLMKNYSWPGNVRELQNILTRAVIIHKDKKILDSHAVSQCLTPVLSSLQKEEAIPTPTNPEEFADYKQKYIDDRLIELEKKFVTYLMDKFNGNVTLAARFMGLSRTNFYKMMQRCGYKS